MAKAGKIVAAQQQQAASTIVAAGTQQSTSDVVVAQTASSSAGVMVLSAEMRQCCSCKINKSTAVMTKISEKICGKSGGGDIETWRCNSCNNLKGRVYRYLTHNPDLAVEFHEMDAEKKAEWLAANHDKYGKHLDMTIRTTVDEIRKENVKISISAGSDRWKSEKELHKAYPDDPDEVKNIMANARQTMHPTRKVLVWEDLQVGSQITHTQDPSPLSILKGMSR